MNSQAAVRGFVLVFAVVVASSEAVAQETKVAPAVAGKIAAIGHHSVIKVLQTDPLPADGMLPVVVKGAKGEFVDFQVFIAGKDGAALSGVDASISDFTDGKGSIIPKSQAYLYRETYLECTKKTGPYGRVGLFPDGLVPIGPDPYYGEQRSGAPFDLAAGRNQGVWVDVFIPPSAAAGQYGATLTIAAKDEPALAIPVRLTVWNFAIPASPSIPCIFFGVSVNALSKGHLGPGKYLSNPMVKELVPLYWKEAIRHRVSLSSYGEYSGWSWDGTSVNWKRAQNPFSEGYDAIFGSFLDGVYPGTKDPYLQTGPKVGAVFVMSFDSGFRQDYSQPVTGKFLAPHPIEVKMSADGKLDVGTWRYMVTSWVEGEGDSSPFFGPFKGEGNEVAAKLDAPGAVTLTWKVPANAKGKKPDGFWIYRTVGPRGKSWEERLIAKIRIKPEDAEASFTDAGLDAGPEIPHLYNATATSELVKVIEEVGKHFKEKGWENRTFAYMFDEPHDRFAFDSVLWYSQVFRKAGGAVRTLGTASLPDPWGSSKFRDWQRALVGVLDTYVVNSQTFGVGYWPKGHLDYQAKGGHVWFYDSNMSSGEPPLQMGLIIDHPALTHRIKFWVACRHNFEGYMYYDTTMNYNRPDVWTANPMALGTNGDGTLFFPGRPAGAEGLFSIGGEHHVPLPSIRLKMTRDSEQDFEYLLLLKKAGQAAFAEQQLNTVFPRPVLAKGLSEDDTTVFLSSVEGIHDPKNKYPPAVLNIEGEDITYTGVDAGNKALTGLRRGYMLSLRTAHKAGVAVDLPPTNLLGSALGDPKPLLQARERIGEFLSNAAK